jgi:hypothetical protein
MLHLTGDFVGHTEGVVQVFTDGANVGLKVGNALGVDEGVLEGAEEGVKLGVDEGFCEGAEEGKTNTGLKDGDTHDGDTVGYDVEVRGQE